MSSKPNMEQTPAQEEQQSGGILLWLLLGILLVMLVGGGLAIASYTGLISLDDIANKARQLPQKIPAVAKYFSAESDGEQAGTTEEEAINTPAESPLSLPVEAVTPQVEKIDRQIPAAKQVISPETAEIMAKAKAEEEKNISRLARLYASMKAEAAAPIINELEDDMVVMILRKMEDEQAAKILTAMEPQRAAKLTMLLAGKPRVVTRVN